MSEPDWSYWQRVYDAIVKVESALWLDGPLQDDNERHAAREVSSHNMAAFKAIEELRSIYTEPKESTP